MSAILIDSVFQAYGTQEVLRGASLQLQQGKITGLLGRNGCGKSTLLKILIGEQQADNVYIGVDGVFARHLYDKPGLINYLPQRGCHPRQLSLQKLVTLYGVSPDTFFADNASLFPSPSLKLKALSGGQARLFEVLLVLAAPVQFTLLDEPFSHIMPVHVEYVKARIRQASQQRGVLVTAHQYKHVMELSDQLYLLHSGTTTVIKEESELVRLGYLKEEGGAAGAM